MARMIPSTIDPDTESYGEKRVFDSLKTLPPEFTVFHSLRWNSKDENENRILWGESDFTVFHPKYGIIVMEVKNGGIKCEDHLWSYILPDGRIKEMKKGPLAQADKSKYKFIELINEELDNAQNGGRCGINSAVWFPSIKSNEIKGELPDEYKKEIVFYEDALQNPEKFIYEAFNFYNSYSLTRLNTQDSERVIRILSPCFNSVQSLSSKLSAEKDRFFRLTKEQNSLLDYLDEQEYAAIHGSAGTGKTILAVEKAKRLPKDEKVLFLCFNKFLKDYLSEQKKLFPSEFENIDFYSIHGLACSKKLKPESDNDDIEDVLTNFDKYGWKYKHIIVDEGQDFLSEHIEYLHMISKEKNGVFYIFYDKNQFVKKNEFPKWLDDAECRLVLSTNCRNTYQIADTSGKCLEIAPKVREKNVISDKPEFFLSGTQKEILKKISVITDEYLRNGETYYDICILTVKTKDKSILSGIEKTGNHSIRNTRDNKGLFFTTCRKFKGLEADIIILIDVDSSTFSEEENKRLFYVGGSRAKHRLTIFYTGEKEDIKKMSEVLTGKASRNPAIEISRSLNVTPRE